MKTESMKTVKSLLTLTLLTLTSCSTAVVKWEALEPAKRVSPKSAYSIYSMSNGMRVYTYPSNPGVPFTIIGFVKAADSTDPTAAAVREAKTKGANALVRINSGSGKCGTQTTGTGYTGYSGSASAFQNNIYGNASSFGAYNSTTTDITIYTAQFAALVVEQKPTTEESSKHQLKKQNP